MKRNLLAAPKRRHKHQDCTACKEGLAGWNEEKGVAKTAFKLLKTPPLAYFVSEMAASRPLTNCILNRTACSEFVEKHGSSARLHSHLDGRN